MKIITETLFFDKDTKIKVPHFENFTKKEFQISFWIYLLDLNDKELLNKGNNFLKFEIKDRKLRVVLENEGLKYEFTSNIPLITYRWTHVSLEYQKTLILKINFEIVKEIAVKEIIMNQLPFYIGYKGTNYLLSDLIFENSIQKTDLKSPSYPNDSEPLFILESYPLKSISKLMDWKANDNERRSKTLIQKRIKNSGQKVIHCHDMMGGYQDDRFLQNGEKYHIYNFKYWSYIDIFIYFSHWRITIPPPSWIDASHKNGVQVLGTFITEWDEGKHDNILLCENFEKVSEKLIDIAKFYNFDGWFINIESDLPDEKYSIKMKQFLEYLTKRVHEEIENGLVIWYDSVIDNGKVLWQNELNEKNKMFFDACDGIFLNYGWKPEMIEKSIQIASNRNYDVYVGIDVFSRGCLGGFDSYKSIELINKYKGSIAIFAPAWTFENKGRLDRIHFERNEERFWEFLEPIELLDSNNWELENQGTGWKIINEGYNDEKAYQSSHKYCKRKQTIDLEIFPKNITDNPLKYTVMNWYQGSGPDYNDKYYFNLTLKDENGKIIHQLNTGEITTSEKWQNTYYELKNIPNVRFIEWEDAGKDIENWGGHFGSKISCSSFSLFKQNKKYYSHREICYPFKTNFHQGIGNHFFKDGNEIQKKSFNNLSYQDIQPKKILMNYIESKHTEIEVYYGSQSLLIEGILPETESFSLFSMNYVIEKSQKFVDITKNDSVHFELVFEDEIIKTKNEYEIINGWKKRITELPSKKLLDIRILCPKGEIKAFIGEISFTKDFQPKISELKYHKCWNPKGIDLGDELFDLNLKWNEEDVEYCEIYLHDKFLSKSFGGIYVIDSLLKNESYEIKIAPFYFGMIGKILNLAIKD